MKFIIYRATNCFVETLASDPNLSLQNSRRSDCGSDLRVVLEAIQTMNNQGKLIKAALVDCELDEVYERTSSINSDWTEHPSVTLLSSEACMSDTDIGDVISDDKGQVYLYRSKELVKVDLQLK